MEREFEILNEYIGKDRSVKIIYRVRGSIPAEGLDRWFSLLEFPIKPFYMWVKGERTCGVYYELGEETTTFYVKFREGESTKARLEIGVKGTFFEKVLKEHEIMHSVSFKSRHVYLLSLPLNFSVKILSPKGYSLRKTRKSLEFTWRKNKGVQRNLIIRLTKL